MEINLDDVDLSVVVNIEILREVLRKMSCNGKRWWIACEPEYSLDRGYISIGFGCPGCVDLLNTMYYRLPILNTSLPTGGSDNLLVLVHSSTVTAEQPGFYEHAAGIGTDEFADIEEFFVPIRRALVPILAEHVGLNIERVGK